MVAARQRNPQHFHHLCTGSALLRTSDPHVCAQTAGKQSCCLPGWQAVADRCAGACVPGQPAGCEDLARAWMRSAQEGSHRMIAVAQRTGRRAFTVGPPIPRIPIGRGMRVLDTLKLARLRRRWSRPACAAATTSRTMMRWSHRPSDSAAVPGQGKPSPSGVGSDHAGWTGQCSVPPGASSRCSMLRRP